MKRCFLLCTLLIGLFVRGQEGSPDQTFAYKGWRAVSYYSGNSMGEESLCTFMQGDRKLLVVFTQDGVPRIARYNENGSLDKSFADVGFSLRIDNIDLDGAARQSDGKIVVLGSKGDENNTDFALVRFNTDGSPDTSFGTNGMAIIDFLGGYDCPTSIAIQSDDKIVVAGEAAEPDLESHFGVARLNADGTPDTEFDSDGKTVTDLAPGSEENVDYANAIAVRDGKIYVCGYVYGNNGSEKEQIALVRYNANGSLDTDFAGSGIVITELTYDAELSTMAVQDDGKILVGGVLLPTTTSGDFLLMRYTASGALDTDFSGDGIVTTSLLDDARAKSLAIQYDGKIVLAGNTMVTDGAWDFAVARYNVDGTPDTEFDEDGVVITDLGFSGNDEANGLTLLPDNKILLTGSINNASGTDFALVQYAGDGSLDLSFNGTGILTGFYPHPASVEVHVIAIQNDGKILAAGITRHETEPRWDLGIARYNPNGITDTTFGVDGIATVNFNSTVHEVSGLLVQNDGKVVVTVKTDAADFALARFNQNGTPDLTFNEDGIVITDFAGSDNISGAAVQPDGKIIAAGEAHNDDFTVVRYTTAGSLDNNFGTGGKVTTDFLGQTDYATGVVVQSDGKIVVAGYAYNATGASDFAIARYTSNGRLDTKFGSGGKVTIDFGKDEECLAIVLQNDGKIVVAGTSEDPLTYESDFVLARLNTNGTLDPTFDTDGKVTTDAGGNDWLAGMTLQSDGKIIIGGEVDLNSGDFNKVYVRYKSNGAIDSTFGTNGKFLSELPGYPYAVAWGNQRLYIGQSTSSSTFEGFLAAYNAWGLPVISINDVKVLSPQENAVLTVSTKGIVSSPITINYATQDGTALSKGKKPDYKSTRGTVVLTAEAASTTISIPINASAYTVGSSLKTFNVNLTLPRQMNGVAELADATGVVTIIPQSTFAMGQNTKVPEKTVAEALSVKAFPNPTASYFTLQLRSGNSSKVLLTVMDVSGRQIERFSVNANSNITLGNRYLPGIYYVEVNQGVEKLVLRLVKQ